MNTSLLAVRSTFVDTVGNVSALSKDTAPKNTVPFSLTSVDNPSVANTATDKTTDNIIAKNTQNISSDKPPLKSISGTPGKKTVLQKANQNGGKEKAKPGVANTATEITTGNIIADISQNVSSDKLLQSISGTPGKKTVSQKANENGGKEKIKTKDSAVRTFSAVNPQRTGPAQELSTANVVFGNDITIGNDSICRQQKSEKTLSNPAQLIKNAYTATLKPVLQHISEGPFVANKVVMQIGDYSRLRPFIVAGSKNAGASISSPLQQRPSLRRAVEPHISPYLKGGDSNGPKNIASGKPAATDTITGSVDKKTLILDSSLPLVQEKPVETKQKVPVITKKSAFIAEKPQVSMLSTRVTNNDAADSKTLVESLNGNKKEPTDNRAGNFSIQKPSIAELQVSVGQPKGRANSTSYNSSNPDPEQIFSPNNAPSLIPEQPPLSTQVINIASQQEQTSLSDVTGSVSEQVIVSIRASLHQADRYVTVRLEPPELGNVLVRFQEQEDEITGLLEVSKAETKYEIEQALPQIIRTLADCGVQIKRLEVQLLDQHEPSTNGNPSDEGLEYDSYQHNRFADGGNPDKNNAEEWLRNIIENNYQNRPEPQQIVTDESINMLI